MYSQGTIQSVRNRVDIVELIGEYIGLKKAGTSFMGLCPFHKEKTPSFHVSHQKQCYYCFGCQAGGDVFSFIIQMEGINFPLAVKKLADRVGIELEVSEPAIQRNIGQEKILRALDYASRFYQDRLKKNTGLLQYLNKRGLSQKTIQKFQLGLSPSGWTEIKDLLVKNKYSIEEISQTGLIVENNGKSYDRFRERLMFPIKNPQGEVVGFGARILKDMPNQPKYINSPESSVFSKRKLLYAYYENQRQIRLHQEALLVEGYMDVLGLYDKGVENAVATMGTALSEEHCQLIRTLTKKVVTIFDPDAAGVRAWKKSVELFISQGLIAKDLTLPDRLDPDDYVLKHGKESFTQLLQKAPRQLTKYLRELISEGSLTEERQVKILESLTPILMATKNNPDRVLIWDSISQVLQVSQEALKELSNQSKGSSEIIKKISIAVKKQLPKKKSFNWDEIFLEAVLGNKESFLSLKEEEWSGLVGDEEIRKILLSLFSEGKENWASVLENNLRQTNNDIIKSLCSAALLGKEMDPQYFKAIFKGIKKKYLETKIKQLTTELKLYQKMGDEVAQLRLLSDIKKLRMDIIQY